MMRKTLYNNKIYSGFVLPDSSSYSALCRKKTDMVTRGKVEAAFCKNLLFITLTYDSKHLPVNYSQVKELQLFRQRITRKKIVTPDVIKMKKRHVAKGFRILMPVKVDGVKWIEKESQPLNLKNNIYRHKEIFEQQDFKNAKFKFAHSTHGLKHKNFSLLVPSHLSDFMEMLRNLLRKDFNNEDLRLRFIANGEYGENTSRAHYHILIFNSLTRVDSTGKDITQAYFDDVVRMLWTFGRILQIKLVKKDVLAIRKLTAYIVGHTVKNDSGNKYQSELSPAFRLMSTYDGGIGHQLVDFDDDVFYKLTDDDDPFYFVRSLKFSLSAWDKRSSIKYNIIGDGEDKKVYNYEYPRYYKDKILGYLNKDIRQYTESQCTMTKMLISDFCKFYNLHDRYDLLDVYLNLGLCASPSDVLTLFMISNRKKLSNFFGNIIDISIFVKRFFDNRKQLDDVGRTVAKDRAMKRKQQQKYQDYLTKSGFYDLD